jgi:hypothetical protein
LARLADCVFKISEGGIREEINTIKMTVSSDMELSQSFHEPTHVTGLEPKKSWHSTQPAAFPEPEGSSPEKVDQIRTKKGNDKVYSYYVQASGLSNFITFIFCLAGLVFGLSFPRE